MKWLLLLVDLLLAAAIAVLPLAWFFDPLQGDWGRISWGWKPVLAPLALLGLRMWLARRSGARGLAGRPLFRKLAFAWLTTFAFFGGIELALRVAGVERVAAVPIVIRGQEDIDNKVAPHDHAVMTDPELLWRFVPGARWDHMAINEHGFRTRPFTREKPPGTRRVLALGDSCTAQGRPPYSDRLHALLQAAPPTPEPWEAFNTGVFGYSLRQGLLQFQKQGRHYQPDVVTIYFGWNDHWLHKKPDRLRMAVRMSPARARLGEAIQKKRLFALLARNAAPPQTAAPAGRRGYRVPPDDYAACLTDLVSEIRAVGATPLLLTGARRELSPALVRGGHADDENEAERAHDEYMELTRRLAAELQVPLLDLAREFEGPACDAYFSKDGIHFESKGLVAIAERLHAKLTELAAAGAFAR